MRLETKKVAIMTFFGVIIFVTKTLIPSPGNKMLVGIQALMLALGALLLAKMGATYVSTVSGFLASLLNIAFAPFTFSFALLYGLLVDAFFFLFRIKATNGEVETGRLVVAMTLSTMVVGFMSYHVTVRLLELLPQSLLLEVAILVMGTISGGVAGYAASLLWNRYLRKVVL